MCVPITFNSAKFNHKAFEVQNFINKMLRVMPYMQNLKFTCHHYVYSVWKLCNSGTTPLYAVLQTVDHDKADLLHSKYQLEIAITSESVQTLWEDKIECDKMKDLVWEARKQAALSKHTDCEPWFKKASVLPSARTGLLQTSEAEAAQQLKAMVEATDFDPFAFL